MKQLIRKIFYINLILFFSIKSFSQIFKTESYRQYNSNYLNYLLHPDTNNKATLINLSYEYLYMFKPKTFKTGGMSFKMGLNLARLFTKKIILGVCADFKSIDGFTKQCFSNNFISDFNSNFIDAYNSKSDSAKAYIVSNSINDIGNNKLKGNNFSNFGIEFSPFPNKYGGILLQVKKGFREYRIFGLKGNKYLSDNSIGDMPISLKGIYSIQLSFKPYCFFHSEMTDVLHMKVKDIYKFIIISFYYEQLNFRNANFDGLPLNQIVKQPFIDKYDKINNFGIKLGLGLY